MNAFQERFTTGILESRLCSSTRQEFRSKCGEAALSDFQGPSANRTTAAVRECPADRPCVRLMYTLPGFPVNLNMYEIKIKIRSKSSISSSKILI